MAKQKTYKVMHWIDMGIFPGTLMFSCGFEYKEIMKMLKHKKAKDWRIGLSEDEAHLNDGNYHALSRTIDNTKTGESYKLFYIIIRGDFGFSDFEYCKLAHEVLHVCQLFLPDCLNRDREYEAEAYLHTHLMSHCLHALRGDLK